MDSGFPIIMTTVRSSRERRSGGPFDLVSRTGSGRWDLLNLLDRAKKLLQGAGSAPVNKTQHYHVTCPAGHRMSGTRNEGYQALRCPTCGEGIFVLPRSPFAEIARPARSPGSARREVAAPDPVLDEPIGLSDPPPMGATENVEGLAEIEWEEVPAAKERAPEPSDARQGPWNRHQEKALRAAVGSFRLRNQDQTRLARPGPRFPARAGRGGEHSSRSASRSRGVARRAGAIRSSSRRSRSSRPPRSGSEPGGPSFRTIPGRRRSAGHSVSRHWKRAASTRPINYSRRPNAPSTPWEARSTSARRHSQRGRRGGSLREPRPGVAGNPHRSSRRRRDVQLAQPVRETL